MSLRSRAQMTAMAGPPVSVSAGQPGPNRYAHAVKTSFAAAERAQAFQRSGASLAPCTAAGGATPLGSGCLGASFAYLGAK